MSTVVTISEGRIEGYLELNEFAEKVGVKPGTLRKEISRGYLSSLTIGKGINCKHYIPENYAYKKPIQGRPRANNKEA